MAAPALGSALVGAGLALTVDRVADGQFRRIVRILKFLRQNDGADYPGGYIVSALAAQSYVASVDGDDEALLNGTARGDERGGKVSERKVSERMVSEILEARLAETFELVYSELRRAGYDTSLPAGVVLTGGTAQLRGIRELAAVVFPGAVRVGVPQGITGLVDSLGTPAYASAVGLLRWGSVQLDEPEASAHGKLVGGALGASLAATINGIGIKMPPPPGAVDAVELVLWLHPLDLAAAVAVMLVLLAVASLVPIVRLMRIPVVDALGHV